MYQLRNLINRTSIPSDPEKDMNADEDFMLLLVHAHVVAAANMLQSINPSDAVADLAKKIVVNYIHLPRIDGGPTEPCDDMGSYLRL